MTEEKCIFIILPDVTNNFKDDEVIEKLEEKNFIILNKKKVHLTKLDIKEIFTYKPEQYNNIDDFYEYIESGLSVICLIEHRDGEARTKLRRLIKHTSIIIKDESYFECLEYQCNLQCKDIPFYFSKNEWYFIRDMNYFFPPLDKTNLERNLIIIKPDVIEKNKISDVINDILNFNLLIVSVKREILTIEKAKRLYEDIVDKEYYSSLIDFMSSDKGIVCLIVEGINCISRCRILCGESLSKMNFEDIPTSCLKRKYGTNEIMNGVHLPDDCKIDKEINMFFSKSQFKNENVILVIKKSLGNPEKLTMLRMYLKNYGFKILEEKIVKNDKNVLKELEKEGINKIANWDKEKFMIIIILSRINCITCLFYLMGSKNVNESKIKRPNSIRSIFCINNDDIILVKNINNIKFLTKKFFNNGKYNDIITVEQINNFFFCKNFNFFKNRHDNIKLKNVFIECFRNLCQEKPNANIANMWISQWIDKYMNLNLDNLDNLDKNVKRHNDICYSNQHEGYTCEDMESKSEKKSEKNEKKNKNFIIIPNINETNEVSEIKIIKYFEKLNYINLNLNELCNNEEKNNSLLGKKIEYTKKKYKNLTVELTKRVLKKTLEKNKLYNKFILTNFSHIIDISNLIKNEIISDSFCLLGNFANKVDLKKNLNKNNDYNDFFLFLKDKNINGIGQFECNSIGQEFLNKGKILIYRNIDNYYLEFKKKFKNNIIIFLGVKTKKLQNIINFLIDNYNYIFINHLSLSNGKTRCINKRGDEENHYDSTIGGIHYKQNYENNDDTDEYFLSETYSPDSSSLIYSNIIEKIIKLQNDNYKNMILCNPPINEKYINLVIKKTHSNIKYFYFDSKRDLQFKEVFTKGVGGKENLSNNYKSILSYEFYQNEIAKKLKDNPNFFKFNLNEKENDVTQNCNNYLYNIFDILKKKIILICNTTNIDVSFIGLYLQYKYPDIIFCDMNNMNNMNNMNKHDEVSYKNKNTRKFVDDVFDNLNYDNEEYQNKILINTIIDKMLYFTSQTNSNYFIFSEFPTNLKLIDLQKLSFFFEIKLCIFIGNDISYLSNFEFSKSFQTSFSSIFYYFKITDSLLILDLKDEKFKINNVRHIESDYVNIDEIKNDTCLIEKENKILEINEESKEKSNSVDSFLDANLINIKNETQINDNVKIKILMEIEKKIKPKLIIYNCPDTYDLKKYLKEKNNQNKNDKFKFIFYEDIFKDVHASIVENESDEYLKKLLKKKKEQIKIQVYIKYLEDKLGSSTNFLFSNIVLLDLQNEEAKEKEKEEEGETKEEETKEGEVKEVKEKEKEEEGEKEEGEMKEEEVKEEGGEMKEEETKEEEVEKEGGEVKEGELFKLAELKKIIHFIYFKKVEGYQKGEEINLPILNDYKIVKYQSSKNEKDNIATEISKMDDDIKNDQVELELKLESSFNLISGIEYNEEEKEDENLSYKKEEKKLSLENSQVNDIIKNEEKFKTKKCSEEEEYNKKWKHKINSLLNKYPNIEHSCIYLNRNLPNNCDNIFCPKIIILFMPQNIHLQFYISFMICSVLKNFISINMENVYIEECVKGKIKNKIKRGRKGGRKNNGNCGNGNCGNGKCGNGECGNGECGNGECGNGECGNGECGSGECGCGECGHIKNQWLGNNNGIQNSDDPIEIKTIFERVINKIKNTENNILLTGFPIIKNKYKISDYFYQFNFLKNYKIDGIISFYFNTSYFGNLNCDENISIDKYEDFTKFINKEFGYNHKLYFKTINDQNDITNALTNVYDMFQFP
ncbi:nucleoside diphosphate kinase, putative [Plasmodium yoelii]|uniref:nucleoside-diphosphate kinase n=1 Tax=Plasmodium yoelii TaxID=5861 RepID=A0A078JZL1_PLAYE|nr:nucleoside diphosphate kinase, putative [Plasmodium yoelii]CDU15888.1 nucleoside diphosphate kinase, putative [Plasmodium yoelii]VTZ71483.1 nucleoside diphosphate kinase, putative [Plasmodium yoelii]|eukprot:XP_022811233.1 nucleoside diphosphate kinase, putative [Plasmodium yoelii]